LAFAQKSMLPKFNEWYFCRREKNKVIKIDIDKVKITFFKKTSDFMALKIIANKRNPVR